MKLRINAPAVSNSQRYVAFLPLRLLITGRQVNAASFFSGLINDVRIYDMALTAEEVAADNRRGNQMVVVVTNNSQLCPLSIVFCTLALRQAEDNF